MSDQLDTGPGNGATQAAASAAAPVAASGRRRGGRGIGPTRAVRSTARYRNLEHRFPPTPMVSADELEAIHNTSLDVLEELGIDVMHEGAREIMKKAGADVRPGIERVRFDRNLILELMKTCPSEFTLHARNPERNVKMGGKNLGFSPSELLASSLASCTLITLRMYINRKQWEVSEINVKIDFERDSF